MKRLVTEICGFQTAYYRQGNSSMPILFIHGGGVDSSELSWKEVTEEISRQASFDLLMVDLPGYGSTEYKNGIVYSQEFYVEFIEAFLRKLGIHQVIMAGISLGAGIAIGCALRNPTLVHKLVLIAPNGLTSKWKLHQLSYHFFVNTPLNLLTYTVIRKSRGFTKFMIRAGLFYKEKNITEQVINEIQLAAHSGHAGKAFKSYQKSEYLGKAGAKTFYLPALPYLTQPVLLFHGKQDRSVPLKAVQQAHHSLHHSRLITVDDARHWPQKEYPKLFCSAFLDFMT